MSKGQAKRLTKLAQAFLTPSNSTHRQYEALRAYFVQELPSVEAAQKFGYSPASFRVLCHEFRKDPHREFFLPPAKGPKRSSEKPQIHQRIIVLRKQNNSIYDISRALTDAGHKISPAAVDLILKEEGFAKLPRRGDGERPPSLRPESADKADANALNLEPRSFRTRFGGLFLFMADLAAIDLPGLLSDAGFPGTEMIPAAHAMRSLLALKLFGNARHSHVMSHVFDEGLALFAGLNVIPKRSFLTEYSCRIRPSCYPKLMRAWFDSVGKLGLGRGVSFDLDFHTIPFHGEDALIEKHYVSKRSRRQKGVLAFVVRDADKHVFCYANSDIRKNQQNDEILRFVEFWKSRTGKFPEELIFDSKLTTYRNLSRLNQMGIRFITLRRRSAQMVQEIYQVPLSAWRRIELKGTSRIYKTPRILDNKAMTLKGYEGQIRQITIADLGHGTVARQPNRALRPKDADRERHCRWDRLLSHGCALVGCRHESQLRSSAHPHGQFSLPPSGLSPRARLPNGKVPPPLPRLRRRDRDRRDRPTPYHRPLPEARTQSAAPGCRLRRNRRSHPMAWRQAAQSDLWLILWCQENG